MVFQHPVSPIVLSSASGCSLGPVSTMSSTTLGETSEGRRLAEHHATNALIAQDQLLAMLQQEKAYRVDVVPCTASSSGEDRATAKAGASSSSSSSRLPYEEWRRKICEWCYKVVDHFRIDREVVGVALNYFDRFLFLHKQRPAGEELASSSSSAASTCRCPSCQRAVDSSTFQLGAMTALYLAIKLQADSGDDPLDEDGKPSRLKLRLSSFVDLSRGQFTAQDICSMERKMLETLQWRINPPTPMTVVSYLLKLMPKRSTIPFHCRYNYDLALHVIHELSRYLTELSVCLAHVSSVSLPSEVAFASILVSMDMLTVAALPLQVRDEFSEAVARLSHMTSPSAYKVKYLKGRLRTCFSPGMLMDDCDIDKQHPISVARVSGLLDMSSITSINQLDRPSAIRKQARVASSTTVVLQEDGCLGDPDAEATIACITP